MHGCTSNALCRSCSSAAPSPPSCTCSFLLSCYSSPFPFCCSNTVIADYSGRVGVSEIKEQREGNGQSLKRSVDVQVSRRLAAGSTHSSPVICSSKLQTNKPGREATESLPGDSTLTIIVAINEKEFPSHIILSPKPLLRGKNNRLVPVAAPVGFLPAARPFI